MSRAALSVVMVIPMAGGDAEPVWMKGEIVRVHHYDKAAILPSVS